MPARLSVYSPGGRLALPKNPFGKDVANLQLFRSLALHGGYEQYGLLSLKPSTNEVLRQDLLGQGQSATQFVAASILDQQVPARAGALVRGSPDLLELSWLRRRTVGDRAYSLVGLVHTLAPPAIRQMTANNLNGPTQPWDAIICTSPAVQDAMRRMFGEQADWLAERTGGRRPEGPALPVVPLGVHGSEFAALADRPDARRKVRDQLGLAEEDILVLWVGRLSFFEKAFPQPMFAAVQQAARQTGRKVCFGLAGWFPGSNDREYYEEAARAHAPDVDVQFLDGNDRQLLGELWAGADIFLSLVDNIQETFGITPIEAMAAGLPVVVSDWDGYRFTVRDGIEGFLVPTLGGPQNGIGDSMAAPHVAEMESYQAYAGQIAQHTAVHIGRCAAAIARLIEDPELRRRMGAAGRERIRTTFDWPVVVRQINALADELAAVRASAQVPEPRARRNPAKGDPFRDFAGFPTAVLTPDTQIFVPPGVTADQVRATAKVRLDSAFGVWRANRDECVRALELVASGQARTVRDVLLAFPTERRRAVDLGLVWMAKYGLLDWLG
jgi:glycosyltransferase involved in cell wall biosynthesis